MYLSQCSLGFLIPTQPNTSSVWLEMVANKKNAALKQTSPSVRQCSELVYRCKRAERDEKNFKHMPSNLSGVWENDHSYVLLVEV